MNSLAQALTLRLLKTTATTCKSLLVSLQTEALVDCMWIWK